MVVDKLNEYIKSTKEKGYSDEQIRIALKGSGWKEEDIITALGKQKTVMKDEHSIEKKTNTLAIIALIMAFVMPLIGIILGIIALGQIKKTGEKGKRLAVVAIVLPIVLFVLFIGLMVLMAFSGFMDFSKVMPERCESSVEIPCQGKAMVYSDSLIIPLRNDIGRSITLKDYSVDECNGEIIFKNGGIEQPIENAQIDERESFSFEISGCDFGKTGDRAEVNGKLNYVYTGSEIPFSVQTRVVGMVS